MQPVNLVAAIAATPKSGVVPPHSENGYRRNGCQLVAYLEPIRKILRGLINIGATPTFRIGT
jgi:hypothetical protein